MSRRGFTLIELLVVVAIVGVLSSIVVASLNSARDKGRMAAGMQFDSTVLHGVGDQLVGQWNFDNTTSPWADTSGYLNDGACVSCPTLVSGFNNRTAASFNGTSNFVNIGQPSVVKNLNSPMTVSAWIKINNHPISGNSSTFIGRQYDWQFGADSTGRLRFTRWATWNVIFSTTNLNTGAWYHVAFTISNDASNNFKFYIDGQSKGSGTIPTPFNISNANTLISGYIQSDIDYFNGLIDDVRIYATSLNQAQIEKLYAEGMRIHDLAKK